jgi:SAM-dependent methyltransferase
MTGTHHATEANDLSAALAQLPQREAFVARLLRRFAPFMTLAPGAAVLDVGAAQGVTVVAYRRAGFEAFGVEPWEPALAVGRQLARETGVAFETRPGVAEALPYDDGSFALVHAYSVLEHVDDPLQVFREVYRVLAPGGGFYFLTSAITSPRQAEIQGFPLFPWYPLALKRAIMTWAARERPWLVGHTTRPAMHWFHHREVRQSLAAIGFRELVDKWTMRAASGELSGIRQLVVAAAARNRAVRAAGEVVIGNCEYLAIK